VTTEAKRKIHTLPGQPTSPKAFCGMLVEHADDIEHIACVIQWKRDVKGEPTNLTNVAATEMPLINAVWLKHVFDLEWPRTAEVADDPESFYPDDRA
jgi:hypothetical protein